MSIPTPLKAMAGLLLLALSSCGMIFSSDTTRDLGIFDGSSSLTEMRAGIWVDPNGCDHWIIDDGFEGYMSPRVDPYGHPVCREGAMPNTSNVRAAGSGR